jgi:hypothetical protein
LRFRFAFEGSSTKPSAPMERTGLEPVTFGLQRMESE